MAAFGAALLAVCPTVSTLTQNWRKHHTQDAMMFWIVFAVILLLGLGLVIFA